MNHSNPMGRPSTPSTPHGSRQGSRHGLRSRRGLSYPECMVCLVINSLLLLAVAGAFSSSASGVKGNSDFFLACQAARVTVNQMVTEVRCCDTVQVFSDHIVVTRPAATLTPNEANRTFSYDSANKRVTLQISYKDGTTSPLYVMTANVNAASFGPADTGTDSNNATVVVRVPVSLTVAVGSSSVVLNGSAAPRRSLRYS
jgi:hypothetical protein